MFVINKIDLKSADVKNIRNNLIKWLKKQPIPYVIIETSARTGEGMENFAQHLKQFAVVYSDPILHTRFIPKTPSTRKGCC